MVAWQVGRSGFGQKMISGVDLLPGGSAQHFRCPGCAALRGECQFDLPVAVRNPRYAPDATSVPSLSEEALFLPVEIDAEGKASAAAPVADITSRSIWRAVTGRGLAAAMIPRRLHDWIYRP